MTMNRSNEEQLYSERRICPECLYAISNPFIERCPRCLTAVPRAEVNCRVCIHHTVCPAASQVEKLNGGMLRPAAGNQQNERHVAKE